MSSVLQPVTASERSGLARRLTRGTLANVLRHGITVGAQVIMLPLLLKHWGTQVYGEWQTLAAAATYVAVLDFGMQTYVVNRMNQAYSVGEMREFTRTLQSALWFSAIIAGLAALVIAPALMLLPLDSWFHLTVTTRGAAAGVAVILAVYTAAGVPAGVICGVYCAVGEYARGVAVDNVYRLGQLTLMIFVVLEGGGLVAVALAQVGALGLEVLFVLFDLRRRHPEVHLHVRERDRTLALSFLAPSSMFFVMQMSAAAAFQGSTLLIGAMLGAGSVAVFVASRTLVNAIRQVTGMLSSTLWPEFTSLEARGNYGALRAAHHLSAKAMITATACAAVFLHFAGREIMAAWSSNRIAYDGLLMDGLLLLQLGQSWYQASWTLLGASNNHKTVAWANAFSSCLGLALGGVLCPRFGPAGVVLGLLAADLVSCSYFVPRAACRLLKERFGLFAVRILLPGIALTACLYGVLFASLPALASAPAMERVGLSGVIVGVAALAFVYVFWLDRSEKQALRGFAVSCLSR